MLKIRWSRDCLIFNMGIPILVRRYLYIEMAPYLNWPWAGAYCLFFWSHVQPSADQSLAIVNKNNHMRWLNICVVQPVLGKYNIMGDALKLFCGQKWCMNQTFSFGKNTIYTLLLSLSLQHKALFQCWGLVKWLQIHYVNWSRVFLSNDLST